MSARRRHCMVVHAYYPYAETRVQREAEALLAAGYDVDVVCLRLPGERSVERVNGVEVHRLPVERRPQGVGSEGLAGQLVEYLRFTLLSTIAVARLHLRRRYGVVQVHNPPDFLIAAALLPKALGARVILDLHDLMPEFLASRLGAEVSDPRVRLVAWQERVACRLADHVITVTEPWRRVLAQRRSAPLRRSSVVMNLADTTHFSPSGPPRARDDEFRVIYHGTLAHRYGIDLLVRAVDRLRQEIPSLRLTIHGRGQAAEPLRRLVQELDLGTIVHFSGEFVPVSELAAIVRTGHLGVVPYRHDVFTDGILPTKLMEYAALGMPALVARSSAIEAYFDDSMVDYFRPGDVEDLAARIAALYRDAARRDALAANIARFGERHNWPSEAADYVALVERLAAPGGP